MGAVMVIEHYQVCGMVTDHDIVVRTVAEARDPATTILADLCRHACVTVSPTDSAACLWSTGGSWWAWCRSGIWR